MKKTILGLFLICLGLSGCAQNNSEPDIVTCLASLGLARCPQDDNTEKSNNLTLENQWKESNIEGVKYRKNTDTMDVKFNLLDVLFK